VRRYDTGFITDEGAVAEAVMFSPATLAGKKTITAPTHQEGGMTTW